MFRQAVVAFLVVAAVSAFPSPRVLGGEAEIEEFPSQASFFIYETPICSASIINERVVLLGAKCILNRIGPKDCNVRVGSALYDEGGQFLDVEQIYMHPNSSRFSFDYNIALVVVSTPIVFDGVTVAPIQFAQSGKPQQGGVVGLVAGWGWSFDNHKELRKATLTVAEHEQCVAIYANNEITHQITERMLCALVDEENATCDDSGSPLIVDGVVVGIASWDTECNNPKYPSVFTDVSTVSDWVVKTLATIG